MKTAPSKQVRRLINKWKAGSAWPKRLEWIEIDGIRGWEGQRLDLMFPFVAIVGENGSGKSSMLQAIAASYKPPSGRLAETYYASDFFPDTPWETITDAAIAYSVREGDKSIQGSIRKKTTRWRGNPQRRERDVYYIDLRRAQPVAAQVGYSRLAKPQFKEARREAFQEERIDRLSSIVGRHYHSAGYSLTDGDENRWVPVIGTGAVEYSGFHQGAGETAIIDLLRLDFKPRSIVLIDEFETSLHPRSQRRLVRDLADQCREKELQIVVTTHSPYVLEELPIEARVYVIRTHPGREFITGVSPDFALTRMDEEPHPELDVYVEDSVAGIMFEEIIARHRLPTLAQCEVIPYGAASVGKSLGQMVANDRFPRRSMVLLDGDQEASPGCLVLPGGDAPERVAFEALRLIGWPDIASKINRSPSDLINAIEAAMTASDHHDWIKLVADRLIVGGNGLWRAMCIVWAERCLDRKDVDQLLAALDDAVNIRGVAPPGQLFTPMDGLMVRGKIGDPSL